MTIEFRAFPKIPRLNDFFVIITEKIDGTNAQLTIKDNELISVGSRNRFITPEDDNYGFARWVYANKEELLKLGDGTHYGEWWGLGIQRNYDLIEKRFSLFNTGRWSDADVRPKCCSVVPILYTGIFNMDVIEGVLENLGESGSIVAPGYMNPEGLVIYHSKSNSLFKKTFDDNHKELKAA